MVALAEPSKETEPATSPLSAIVLAVARVVAVSALPVTSPTNPPVAVTIPEAATLAMVSEFALRTSVLFTFSTLPVARLMFSDEPKLSPVASNWNVLLPSPELTVIPAPSAAASLAAPSAT